MGEVFGVAWHNPHKCWGTDVRYSVTSRIYTVHARINAWLLAARME